MQHPDEGTIHAWLDGALPPAEHAALADHVMQCAECGAAVAEARGMIAGASRIVAALDVVRGGVLPRVEAKRGWSAWRVLRLTPARAAIAATLMVAAASMLAIRHQSSVVDLGHQDSPIPHTATAVPVPHDSASPAAAPAPAQAAGPAPAPAAGRASLDSISPLKKARVVGGVAQPAGDAVSRDSNRAVTTRLEQQAPATVVAKAGSALRGDTAVREAAKATGASPVSAAPAPQIPAPRRETFSSVAVSAEARLRNLADNAQQSVAGCYRISNDSGAGAGAGAAQSSVPPRFVLQHGAPAARGGPLRNVALRLTPAGQVDTLEQPGVWRALSRNTVSVSWTPAATLTMTFAPGAVVGDVLGTGGATARRVEISRMECAF